MSDPTGDQDRQQHGGEDQDQLPADDDLFGQHAGTPTQSNSTAFVDWINVGLAAGWISEPFCDTHDMAPFTDEEQAGWDDGLDCCAHAVRLWGPGGTL